MLRDLPRRSVLTAGLVAALMTGCGEPEPTPSPPPPIIEKAPTPGPDGAAGSAGSAGSDHANSGEGQAGMNAGVIGLAGPMLSPEKFSSLMKENNSLMAVLKLSVRSKDRAQAAKALDKLAENAAQGQRSRPEKNAAKASTYLAMFGAQKASALALKSMIEMEAWDALGPQMRTLGKNCASCHTMFRLSKSEKAARDAAAAGGAAAPATMRPATPKPGASGP